MLLHLSDEQLASATAQGKSHRHQEKAMNTATSTDAFAMQGVRKSFRHFQLEGLDLQLPLGQIMGLVGPNGAGKSTTIRLLMGLIAPEAGSIEVLGNQLPGDVVAAKRDVAFVSDDMSPVQHGDAGVAHAVHRLDVSRLDEAYARRLLKSFNLRTDQWVGKMSRGEHVKAMLLLALARRPLLLVLDEPTSGLDRWHAMNC